MRHVTSSILTINECAYRLSLFTSAIYGKVDYNCLFQITSRSFFTHVLDTHEVIKTSEAYTFIYHYGTQSAWLASTFQGMSFKGSIEFYPAENLIISYGYNFASDEPCSISVFSDQIV